MQVADMPHRTALYRLFSADDVLLYVGISDQPEARRKQHVTLQPWGREIARQVVEWHPDRAAAKRAEGSAIASEVPRYNREGKPTGVVTVEPGTALSIAAARQQMPALIERARYFDGVTYLLNRGKRVAAIVPVEVAERWEAEQQSKKS